MRTVVDESDGVPMQKSQRGALAAMEFLDFSHQPDAEARANKEMFEVLGFPINPALEEGLQQVNLLNVRLCPAKRILTIESDKTSSGMQLHNHFIGTGADSEYQHIPTPRAWLRRRGGDNVVVPRQMLQTIVGWVSRITT